MARDAEHSECLRDREILELIEREPSVTQRGIARELRIALGLTNSCLKRMVRKGWIKINEAPGRRLLYYLTPRGMREKTRLTYEYIAYSVRYYQDARERCARLFQRLSDDPAVGRVAFLGRSDLAEIAYLTLMEYPLEFVALYEASDSGRAFFGHAPRALALAINGQPADHDRLIYTRLEPPENDPSLQGLDVLEIF